MDAQGAAVADGSGAAVVHIPREDVAELYAAFLVDEQQLDMHFSYNSSFWTCKPTGEGMGLLRRYVYEVYKELGPAHQARKQTKALRDSIIGIVLSVAGVVMTVAGHLSATRSPDGARFYVFWGLILAGVAMLFKAFGSYRESKKIQRILLMARQDK
jgi:hypothetical protein